MPSKETWGYINRGINGQGSVGLSVYSFVNSYKKGEAIKASADLTSSLHDLTSLAVNNHATTVLGRVAAKFQLAAITEKALGEINSSGTLTNQTTIDLTFAIVGLAALGLSGAAAFAVASVGLGVGVLSLLQDKRSWNDGAAIWDTEGTEIFDTIIDMFSDETIDDIFQQQEAFAVAQLLKNIDPSIDNGRIEEMFDSVSISSVSPERILNIVGDVLDIGDTVSSGDTDALYNRLGSINAQIFEDASQQTPSLVAPYKGLKIVDTQSLSGAAHSNSANGYAYRYALQNLNSIAVSGGSSLYSKHNIDGELDAENFSAQYLVDREAMLDLLIQQNMNDRSEYEVFVSDKNRLYQDLTSGETVSTYASGYQYNDTASRIIFGTDGDDLLSGGSLEDHIYGAAGNDVLIGNAGDDYMEGNMGNDVYILEGDDTIVEMVNAGIDTVKVSHSYTLLDNFENLQLKGDSAIDATGNDLLNVIMGNEQDNVIMGMAGDDHLWGRGGDDILYGGEGADTMDGGYGYDIYYADSQDVIMDADGRGCIILNGVVLSDGVRYLSHGADNYAEDMYRSGNNTYQLIEGEFPMLVINGGLTIVESGGLFGIELSSLEGPRWEDDWPTIAESYRVDIDQKLNDFMARVHVEELISAMATFDDLFTEDMEAPPPIPEEGTSVVAPPFDEV